jgi:hypothetical protein
MDDLVGKVAVVTGGLPPLGARAADELVVELGRALG